MIADVAEMKTQQNRARGTGIGCQLGPSLEGLLSWVPLTGFPPLPAHQVQISWLGSGVLPGVEWTGFRYPGF